MNRYIKYSLIWFLSLFILFGLGSLAIMLLVNNGFTNESSGQWVEINIKEKDSLAQLFENSKNNIEIKTKYQGFEWFEQEKDLEEQYNKYSLEELDYSWISEEIWDLIKRKEKTWDTKIEKVNSEPIEGLENEEMKNVYACLKEGLVFLDTSFNEAKMSFKNIYDISNSVWFLVPSFSVYKNYCVQDPLGGKEKVAEIIKPWKFKDMIISDLHLWEHAHYVKNFLEDERSQWELNKIEQLLKIDKRIIMAIVMVEQIRSSETDRWTVKKMAEKSLLNAFTMFSLWISWIKVNTAEKVEAHLKNPQSRYYLGKEYENILNFETKNIADERFKRLTRNDTYYWQFLYSWIISKMFIEEWKKAWFSISYTDEDWTEKTNLAWVIWTLFNLWENPNRKPHWTPALGGAIIPYGTVIRDGKVVKWEKNSWLFWELAQKNYIFLLTEFEK